MKIKHIAAYTVLFLAAYTVFLAARFPAAYLYGWLKQHNRAPAELYQVNGNVWDGRAGTAVVGTLRFDALEWSFRPQGILLGRLEYQLAANLGKTRVDAVAGRALNRPFYASDMRMNIALVDLIQLLGLDDLGLTGRLDAEIRHLEIKDHQLAFIEGTLELSDAAFGPPVNLTLGGATMKLETSGEVVKGIMKDTGGPLQVDGVLILQRSGDYQISAGFSARDPNNDALRQALRFIGPANPAGKVSLNRRGRIDLGSYL